MVENLEVWLADRLNAFKAQTELRFDSSKELRRLLSIFCEQQVAVEDFKTLVYGRVTCLFCDFQLDTCAGGFDREARGAFDVEANQPNLDKLQSFNEFPIFVGVQGERGIGRFLAQA